ncbi:MAG: hypothetical protein A2Y87_05885 [Bacteroidetes bacterium RBG_13_46_8]|nr:MAG: hypothetical protein A2Y87_05885 [Bacteroidetes bacterium RBG_13_46_8]
MKTIFKFISFAGLALTIVPSFFVFRGVMVMKTHYLLMAIGFVLWFATAPFWIKSKSLEEEEKQHH